MNTVNENNELILTAQSRSFAIPILKLEERLKRPIMTQYNLNKFIDTIEDNPKISVADKMNYFSEFNTRLRKLESLAPLAEKLIEITPKEEAYVFIHAESISKALFELPDPMKGLAILYNAEMSKGMCHFLNYPIHTMEDLDNYCYYVAGTVGIYLMQVVNYYYPFQKDTLSLSQSAKHFGLFLQKLNILRDYHEDTFEKNRHFWPRDLLATHPKETVFKMIVESMVKENIPQALTFYEEIPKDTKSFIDFNRFLLHSGLSYLNLMLKEKSIFHFNKLKLPRTFIETLYDKMTALTDSAFLSECQSLQHDCEALLERF